MLSTLTEETILEAVAEGGHRLTDEEALALLERGDLKEMAAAAHRVRLRKTDPRIVTYVKDRNVNYTNVCVTDCDFCAFYRRPGDNESYVNSQGVIDQKIQELVDAGGTQLLMQGGHHPYLKLDYYIDLLSHIHEKFPTIDIHSFSPSEIQHVARLERMTPKEMLRRFKAAGMKSLPGGGAEILVDRVRDIISPKKTTSDEWIDIMRDAHELGMPSTATMMFGHVETLAERIRHLRRLRDLQDETGAFTAFICWPFQNENHRMSHLPKVGGVAYLRTQAVGRLYLDNFTNFQASWVTMGPKIGQLSLSYGVNDMGGTMMEENVVSEAGCIHCLNEERIRELVAEAGYEPRQRDTYYKLLNIPV